jgi:hypothetical protein
VFQVLVTCVDSGWLEDKKLLKLNTCFVHSVHRGNNGEVEDVHRYSFITKSV